MAETANCPICGIPISGETANEAGYNMGEHMREQHGNERKN